jgi:hypothetical protein
VVNFTLPIASSSEAKNEALEQAVPKHAGMNERTWVKRRLEGSQSIILEHVQECLRDPIH